MMEIIYMTVVSTGYVSISLVVISLLSFNFDLQWYDIRLFSLVGFIGLLSTASLSIYKRSLKNFPLYFVFHSVVIYAIYNLMVYLFDKGAEYYLAFLVSFVNIFLIGLLAILGLSFSVFGIKVKWLPLQIMAGLLLGFLLFILTGSLGEDFGFSLIFGFMLLVLPTAFGTVSSTLLLRSINLIRGKY